MTNFANANGFAPEYWGPSMWRVIHMIAATYPVRPTHRDKVYFFNFYTSLKRVLPCGGCRESYSEMISRGGLKLTDQVMATRMTLFAWTVSLHNAVNVKLGKAVQGTVDSWYAHYDRLRPGPE